MAEFDHHKCSNHSNEKMVSAKAGLSSRLKMKLQRDQNIPAESRDGSMVNETWPQPIFDLLNLVPSTDRIGKLEWKVVGNITKGDGPIINTIRLPSTPTTSSGGHESKHRFRVVTGIAPPFVQESTRLDNGSCLMGVHCLRVRLTSIFQFVFTVSSLIDSHFDF